MQNFTTIIAIIALLFSFSGLTVSILAYRRDRSRVRAWSSVEWVPNGPETATVRLRIRIANGGRRPVALMFLVRKSGKHLWWQTLQKAEPTATSAADLVRELERNQLAHVGSVRLSEGDAFEMVFGPDDDDEFVALHWNDVTYAESLLVEDVMGNRYPVRGSARHLKEAFREWSKPQPELDWSPGALPSLPPEGGGDEGADLESAGCDRHKKEPGDLHFDGERSAAPR